MRCQGEGCEQTAMATVQRGGDVSYLCLDCVYNRYGLRPCEAPGCGNASRLTFTVAWDNGETTKHRFCSELCAAHLLEDVDAGALIDELIADILGDS